MAQGTLLNALWWPKWKGNGIGDNDIRIAGSLCCTAGTDTALCKSNYISIKINLKKRIRFSVGVGQDQETLRQAELDLW